MVTKTDQKPAGCIIFYCKDCMEIVDAKKIGKKYIYSCPKCKGKNVAFGTEKSIKNYFHIKEK